MNINKNKNIFNSIVYKNVQYIYNLYILRFFLYFAQNKILD